MILHINKFCLTLWMMSDVPRARSQLTLVMNDHAEWGTHQKKWYVELKCGPFDNDCNHPVLKFAKNRETFERNQDVTVVGLTNYHGKFYRYPATVPAFYQCSTGESQTTLTLNSSTINPLHFLENKIEELGERLEIMETSVSFFAKVDSSGSVLYYPNAVVPFRLIVTSIGGGLNATTGTFTTPVAGVYLFDVTAHGYGDSPQENHRILFACLMADDSTLTGLALNNDGFQNTLRGSVQAVVELRKNQTVYLQNRYYRTYYLYFYSTFSGTLLRAMTN